MKMSNPFDFNEDEASKEFEKTMIFGESPGVVSSRDFMKKSLAAANMLIVEEENEDGKALLKDTSVIYSAPSPAISGKSSFRGNYPDLGDVVKETPQFSSKEYFKLQDELYKAKKLIEVLKQERWKKLPARETIERIVQGKPYWLEGYKSLREKLKLLEYSCVSNDGNSICTVVLFLEKTLKTCIFRRELRNHKVAMQHYIQYLRNTNEWCKLEQLYSYLGMLEEAATLRYEQVNLLSTFSERCDGLNKWLREFGHRTELSELKLYVSEEIALLETQVLIDVESKQRVVSATDTVLKYQPPVSIQSKPLIYTISYCAHHYFEKNSKFHPDTFKKTMKLSNKQFEWAILPPRAYLHRWTDVQEILTSTSWLRRKGDASYIGYENVATVLYQTKANSEVLSKYLNLISNLDLRIKYATRFQVHDVVINAIILQRDREKMEGYRMKVGNSSKHHQKINDALNTTSIKWK